MADADSVRAGGASVELQADPTKLRQGLSAGQAAVKRWGDTVAVGLTPMRATIGLVQQLGGAVTGLGYTLGGIGLALGGLGAAILGPIGLALHSFAESNSELLAMSDRTGIAVESLAELKYAAMQSAVGMGTLEMAIRRTQQAVAKAGEAKGGKAVGAAKSLGTLDIGEDGAAELSMSGAQAAESIGKLGINLQKLQGMSTEEQFLALAKAVGQIGDRSEKTRVAMELWGRSGTQLMPLLGNVDALRARFRELNLGTSRESAENALKLQQAYNDVGAVFKKIGSTVAGVLAPAVTTLLQKQAEHLSTVIGWVKAHKDLVIAAGLAGVALVGLGGAFGFLGAATLAAGSLITTGATVATAAVGTLGLVFGIVSGAMALVDASAAAMVPLLASLAPAGAAAAAGEVAVAAGATLIDVAMGGLPLIIGAVVVGLLALALAAAGAGIATGLLIDAVVVGGVAAFLYFSGAGSAALKFLGEQFAPLLKTAKATWGGVVDAISSGDLQGAAQIAWLGVKVSFLENLGDVLRGWYEFSTIMQVGFATIAAAAEKAANVISAVFKTALDPANAAVFALEAQLANKTADRKLKDLTHGIVDAGVKAAAGVSAELDKARADLERAVAQANERVTHARAATVVGGLGLAALGGGPGGAGAPPGVKEAAQKISAVGTFSAAAVFGLGGGGPLEGIERNTAQANGHLKKIAAAGRFKIV